MVEKNEILWKNFERLMENDHGLWEKTPDLGVKLHVGVNMKTKTLETFTLHGSSDNHAVIAGSKDVSNEPIIHSLVAGLVREYKPSDIELWLLSTNEDEFSPYVDDYSGEGMLPHLKVCVGRDDPNYVACVLKELKRKMMDRLTMLRSYGIRSVEEFNSAIRYGYLYDKVNYGRSKYVIIRRPEEVKPGYVKVSQAYLIPQIIFIMDDYQKIYEYNNSAELVSLMEEILAFSKKCGIHFIMCSNNFKMRENDMIMQNLTLRIVTKCDVALSKYLIGQDFAAMISNNANFVVVHSEMTGDKDCLLLFPEIDSEDIIQNNQNMYKAMKESDLPDTLRTIVI